MARFDRLPFSDSSAFCCDAINVSILWPGHLNLTAMNVFDIFCRANKFVDRSCNHYQLFLVNVHSVWLVCFITAFCLYVCIFVMCATILVNKDVYIAHFRA